jgi:16S rRNA (cytidine1402-2'-O)-methyltransferase
MSTLWLVATPIGNMGDLSPRAVETLAGVDLVCCEDTRRTGLLLQRAGVRAERLAVCNDHTESACAEQAVAVLDGGADVAIVSDAGSPGISDPGERVVRAVIDRGHDVAVVPGPSAAIAALTVSGLPASRFCFEGFLPRKGRERARRLDEIATERRTTVIYEAPHRARRTLDDLGVACGGDRTVVVTRELTKLHEETIRGRLSDIDIGEPRGEYVFVLDGAPEPAAASDDDVGEQLAAALAEGTSTRDAATAVAERTGRRRRDVYQAALAIAGERTHEPRTAEEQAHHAPPPGAGS